MPSLERLPQRSRASKMRSFLEAIKLPKYIFTNCLLRDKQHALS